jgi:hypothetical protein
MLVSEYVYDGNQLSILNLKDVTIHGDGDCHIVVDPAYAFVLNFIPPAQISTGSPRTWVTILVVGCLIVIVIPFIIYALRKPSWKSNDADADFAPFHWEKQ